MSILNLLTDASNQPTQSTNYMTWIILGAFVIILVIMFIFTSRSNKKKNQEAEERIKAVRPGNKVKTIGGICGIVVEVNDDDNTFVLETGNEEFGKHYIKFDKQAIYQTDAKTATEIEAEKKAEEKKAEEKAENKTEETAVEVPADEVKTEENNKENE